MSVIWRRWWTTAVIVGLVAVPLAVGRVAEWHPLQRPALASTG